MFLTQLLLLAGCFVLVLFALLVLPLSMAFTGELAAELREAAAQQGWSRG